MDLHAEQVALEREAVQLGEARYEKRKDRDQTYTPPGKSLVKRMVPPLAEAVRDFIQDAKEGKASHQAGLAQFLDQFEPEAVAFITARYLLSVMGGETKQTTAATRLASILEEVSLSHAAEKHDPKAFRRLMNKLDKNASTPAHRHIIFKKGTESIVRKIRWNRVDKARLGTLLIQMYAETSKAFEIKLVRQGKQTPAFIVPLPETLAALASRHARCALLSPMHLPMVIPPCPWTNKLNDGGYLDKNSLRLRLVNTRQWDKQYTDEVRNARMPMVYEAVNALQETPWRINRTMLRIIRELWDNGSTLGMLPMRDDKPIPERPAKDAPKEVWADYKGRTARIYEENEQARSKRLQMQYKILIGEKFEQYPAIYFPHHLDWRGRAYPVPPALNPQADDSGKALLEFANGLPLGDNGAYWMAVHGANSFGIDKVPFEERVEWVEKHTDEILACAIDPFRNTFWNDADSPFQFLAFCFEWTGLTMHVRGGGAQEEFVSHLVCSWDGSCNGLQNFSAMLRDEVGGAATNLVPAAMPADIYRQVAEEANRIVEDDVKHGRDVNAVYWRGKVTRGIAKRPTMTMPYGASKFGYRGQIQDELQTLHRKNGKRWTDGDEFYNSMYMSGVMQDALGRVVVKAREAMDWLQSVANIAASDGLPLWWTTPVGFPVRQSYRHLISKQVQVVYGTRRIKFYLDIEGDTIDKRRQANGVSPNFVHSLDAAHLIRTVCYANRQGITHFSMVHDSYGTHAGRAEDLHRILREAFVEQYSANVLDKFRDEIVAQLPRGLADKLPPMPVMGTLELERVKDAEFFFA